MSKALTAWCDSYRFAPRMFEIANTAQGIVDGVQADERSAGEQVTPSEEICKHILAAAPRWRAGGLRNTLGLD